MSREDLITVAEAAERAGVTRRAIEYWFKKGRLTRHYFPGRPNRVWVDPVELDRAMNRPTIEDVVASAPSLPPEIAEQIRALLRRGGAA